MPRNLQLRVVAVVLALTTVAACVLAGINFQKEQSFAAVTDGAWWSESTGGLAAQRVLPGSPAERAGIKTGDILLSVNEHPTARISRLERELYRVGIYGRANYTISRSTPERSNVRLEVPVILEPADRSINIGLRFIALVYLLIGLYILLRRWTAPKSLHFYIFCLASFVYYSFHYTGKLNLFDWIIYWGSITANALQPALFLHFALTFPRERIQKRLQRALVLLTYVPGLLLLGVHIAAIKLWSPTEVLNHRLNQIDLGYMALYYVMAAVIFSISYRRADAPLLRQQLKWLTRGTFLAITPFTALYVIPYLSDANTNGLLTRLSALSLIFLPLTFSYAIVRYRLMDVDLIFKRGVTYTVATGALVGIYFSVVAVTAELVRTRLPNFGIWGLLAAIVGTSLLFDPLKRAIQDRVDRLFDRKRYDYRTTLIQFGRGLSTQTDLDTLLSSVVDRLPRTLLVSRVAVFLADDSGRQFKLATSHGLPLNVMLGTRTLDLGFLNEFNTNKQASHIFLESAQHALHLPDSQRQAAAQLDLNYYLPCRVVEQAQAHNDQRLIAVIGLGRTVGGDFLSSEDVELLESLASYIGIAIQNATLYARLDRKIVEYERLKEFNENIVESINIGIFALDLEDRIESWNAQMEVMYSKSRAEVVSRSITDLFPPDFIAEYERVKNDPGVHNLYKFRLTTPTGEMRTANIAIAPLIARDFTTVGRIILVDDITNRIELETQLTQAEKLSSIGLLAAGVAHEVNTPLAVISSYTQMLAKQLRTMGEQRHGNSAETDRLSPLLDKITQQTFRASEIVNGLLNFSRTSGSEFNAVDLNTVVHDTLTLLEHQFKTARIEIDLDLEEDLPAIQGNQGKLQQVFLNLFLNAKDAMTDGGTLRIATASNGAVTVSIGDTGSGISPENMRRIYDPFFTTKSAPLAGQRRGTGLGLAVSYGIIQEHAGKIQVNSKVGRGTTFHLEFPMLRRPAHA